MAPKKITPLPTWADPQQEREDDPLWQWAIKKAIGLSGLDDPQAQVMQVGMPTPLISMYKNTAARELGTTAFRQSVRAFSKLNANRMFEQVALEFAKRYPRIAAHMRLSPETISGQIPKTILDPKTSPMNLNVSTIGSLMSAMDKKQATEMIYKEGTRAAHALGNKDAGKLYGLAEKLTEKAKVPFELTSGDRGARATNELLGGSRAAKRGYNQDFRTSRRMTQNVTPIVEDARKYAKDAINSPASVREAAERLSKKVSLGSGNVPYTVNRGLEELANSKANITPEMKEAADQLRAILERRRTGTPTLWE